MTLLTTLVNNQQKPEQPYFNSLAFPQQTFNTPATDQHTPGLPQQTFNTPATDQHTPGLPQQTFNTPATDQHTPGLPQQTSNTPATDQHTFKSPGLPQQTFNTPGLPAANQVYNSPGLPAANQTYNSLGIPAANQTYNSLDIPAANQTYNSLAIPAANQTYNSPGANLNYDLPAANQQLDFSTGNTASGQRFVVPPSTNYQGQSDTDSHNPNASYLEWSSIDDSDYLSSTSYEPASTSRSESELPGPRRNLIPNPSKCNIPKPPFSTPPKLEPVEQVMNDNPGSDVASLRNLTISLAKNAIFGREQLCKCSLRVL